MLSLGDHLDLFAILGFRIGSNDRPCDCFDLELCRHVGLLSLDDIVVTDEVCEDETIKAVAAGCVERLVDKSAGGIDDLKRS